MFWGQTRNFTFASLRRLAVCQSRFPPFRVISQHSKGRNSEGFLYCAIRRHPSCRTSTNRQNTTSRFSRSSRSEDRSGICVLVDFPFSYFPFLAANKERAQGRNPAPVFEPSGPKIPSSAANPARAKLKRPKCFVGALPRPKASSHGACSARSALAYRNAVQSLSHAISGAFERFGTGSPQPLLRR